MKTKVICVSMSALALMAIVSTGPALGQVAPLTDDQRSRIPPPPPIEADAPRLTRLSDASLQGQFHIDPAYSKPASVKVVGAYTIDEWPGGAFLSAWGRGFMPESIAFSDGRCFSFHADYLYGTLWNGRLNRVACVPTPLQPTSPKMSPPAGSPLRLVASQGRYAAWRDEASGTTFVTAPFADKFAPFFSTRLHILAMFAVNGVDFPGGNITFLTRLDGRLTLVTLEVMYDRSNWGFPQQ